MRPVDMADNVGNQSEIVKRVEQMKCRIHGKQIFGNGNPEEIIDDQGRDADQCIRQNNR